ncbi:DUF6777 domain-containing protein [Streptomyces sp. DSM 41987]|uniref:DUF6777 domain-containing protein n=1 Tax=Streptomyces TaxID=1883 RepID=UPI0018E03E07|nr:DUF6777 domain-containing protein [Streptomyces fildesensis]
MTSAPPPESHPTGPPSGPLAAPRPSDPTQAMPRQQPAPSGQGGSPGGPEDGSGGRGGGGGGDGSGGPGDHRPWWRSAPRVALIAVVLVAAVALVVFLTRPDKKSADTSGSDSTGPELLLQPAAAAGTAPFTQSTAKDSSEPASASPMPSLLSSGTDGTSTADGSAPGLYGGTLKVSSCDVERQIDFLTGDAAKAKAFAGVEGIEPSEIPAYLRSLTPVQLRMDTSVTNHGFKDGKATAFQSVLQTGTAVLVGDRGEPRVRCACGNPLQSPAPAQNAKTTGQAWPSYDPAKVVTVADAKKDVDAFVLYDAQTDQWFKRPRGDTGATDTLTNRPGSVTSTPPTTTHSATPSPHSSTTTHSPSPTPTHSPSTTPTPTPTPTTTAPTTSAPAPEPLTS